MFTGIVEQKGTIKHTGTANGFLWVTLEPEWMWADVAVGESIAVSGVCLTVASRTDTDFTVELSRETLAKTAGNWQQGAAVNFERALRLSDCLGGHMVSGHVDGVGTILAINEAPGAVTVDVEAPLELARYLVPKGSVTVDGVSLTVVKVGGPAGNAPELAPNRFQLWLVPHTLAVTSLGSWRPGTPVNLEADTLAKYLERLVALRDVQG